MIVNNYFHGKKLSYNQSYLNTLIAGIILEIAPLPPPPLTKRTNLRILLHLLRGREMTNFNTCNVILEYFIFF